VFKIRTNTLSDTSNTIKIVINVAGKDYTISIAGIAEEAWVTYVMDLEEISAYVKDTDGKYPEIRSMTIQLPNQSTDTGVYMDIAYFAAFDCLTEVAALADTAKIQFCDNGTTTTLTKTELNTLANNENS
jgi:hypothetical protein